MSQKAGWIVIAVIYSIAIIAIAAYCCRDRKPEGFSPILNHSELK